MWEVGSARTVVVGTGTVLGRSRRRSIDCTREYRLWGKHFIANWLKAYIHEEFYCALQAHFFPNCALKHN